MLLPPFELHAPASVKEAVETAARLGAGNFDWVAGGTDLLPNYKWGLNARPHVISLHNVAEMRAVDVGGNPQAVPPTAPLLGAVPPSGRVTIGAMATLREIEQSKALAEALPVIPKAASLIASPLIRASATLGGNLMLDTRCFYLNQGHGWRESKGFCMKADGDACLVVPQKERCYANFSADLPAPLIALGAEVELAGPDGLRTIPLRDLYAGDGIERHTKRPDELLVRATLPQAARAWRADYQKLRLRDSWDFPEAGVAVALKLDGDKLAAMRIVATAVGTVPLVMDDVAEPWIGKRLDDAAVAAIAAAVEDRATPVKNTFYPPSYRKKMCRVLTKRAVRGAVAFSN